jgi:hypothetical protein
LGFGGGGRGTGGGHFGRRGWVACHAQAI